MGLDNIPHNYACKSAGTAVMVNMKDARTGEDYIDEDGNTVPQIDCKATQECGGCPWKNDLASDGLVVGIFGTDCWYRGKYGAFLLDTMEIDANPLWGNSDHLVTPEVCHSIADEMEAWIDENAITEHDGERRIILTGHDEEDVTDQVFYLMRWLRWVADKCDGAVAWF